MSYLGYTSVSHAAYSPSWANRASSTKPEVHNLLQCRQQRTEQRPQVTCTWSLNTLFLRHANGQTQLPSCDTSIKWFDALITYLVPNTAAQLKPLPVSRPSYSVLEASEERQFKQLIYMANAYTLWTYEDSRRLLNHGVRKVVLFGGQLYQSGQCAKVNWVGVAMVTEDQSLPNLLISVGRHVLASFKKTSSKWHQRQHCAWWKR